MGKYELNRPCPGSLGRILTVEAVPRKSFPIGDPV